MACIPEEQNLLIVAPAVVTGKPPLIAICLAIFPPVAPSGIAHPIRQSSTVEGSTPETSIAFSTACPAKVAPCVLLKAPL